MPWRWKTKLRLELERKAGRKEERGRKDHAQDIGL